MEEGRKANQTADESGFLVAIDISHNDTLKTVVANYSGHNDTTGNFALIVVVIANLFHLSVP